MKTSRLFLAMALLCVAASSCKKDDGKETPEVNVAWAPATAISGAVSFTLGQTQSIAMTAENIDFVTVTSKPEAWTVSATPDKIEIKAPTGLEASFDLSGEIKLEAVNRDQEKNIPLSVNVAVDESKISGKIEFTSDVVYTQVFSVGETKTFEYAASFVNKVSATAPNGWTVSVDESAKTVSVTAPASFEGKVTISGDVVLSANSITGAEVEGASFGVALPVYSVMVPPSLAAKVMGIYDEDGNGLGIVCKTSEGKVALVKGKTVPVSGAFAVFTNSGDAVGEYEGEAQPATLAPYTVKDTDGNEYNTIYANGKIFMDSNLKAANSPAGTELASMFPGQLESNVAEYGLLYTQATAFDGQDPADGAIQGICPEGWHLPLVSDIAPEYNSETDGLAIKSFDMELYNSFKASAAGMMMVIPMGNMTIPVMFGQAVSFQLSSPSYITMVFQDGIELEQMAELQTNPATFMSVRCVKDTLPFSE